MQCLLLLYENFHQETIILVLEQKLESVAKLAVLVSTIWSVIMVLYCIGYTDVSIGFDIHHICLSLFSIYCLAIHLITNLPKTTNVESSTYSSKTNPYTINKNQLEKYQKQ